MGSKILEFIKVEHTLFSLPFIYAGTILALWVNGIPLSEFWRIFLLVTIAAIGARTAAMSINRIVDKNIDSKNPRTSKRVLASGQMKLRKAYAITIISIISLLISSYLLNNLAFILSPIPVILFVIYPFMKRISWLTHFFLGIVWSIGPLGGWVAVTGNFEAFIIPIYLAITGALWVAGFDIIYAVLDFDFDKKEKIHSIPAKFGVKKSLNIAFITHVVMFIPLMLLWSKTQIGNVFLGGIMIISAMILYEHVLSRTRDEGQINKAFFGVNAIIGWVLLASIILSIHFVTTF